MSAGENMYHDKHEDARIERTITLSEGDIRAAARVMAVLTGLDEGLGADPRAQESTQNRDDCRARAREYLQGRRKRTELFGKSMFGEPAWDMLVTLYAMETSGPRQTIGTLVALSGAPKATGMRWIQYLEGHNLVEREAHPVDRRTAFVHLTEKARRLLDAYFSGTAMK